MKSKTSLAGLPVLLTMLYLIAIVTLSAGCSSRGPRFVSGDRVIINSNGIMCTGTVVQAELGMNLNRECPPNMLYYQIRFGSVPNNREDLDVAWFPDKFLKKRAP